MSTLDRYGHIFPGTQKEAADRLDETVFGNSVSKLLANPAFEANPQKTKPPKLLSLRGLDLVAGAGFEPATFGL